jgi:hypothetical protein
VRAIVILALLSLVGSARASDPQQFTVTNRTAPAFVVTNRIPPAPPVACRNGVCAAPVTRLTAPAPACGTYYAVPRQRWYPGRWLFGR